MTLRARARSLSVASSVVLVLLTGGEAHAKKIALEAAVGSCVAMPGEVYARVSTLLTARGHTVDVVDAAAIDTPAEIGAYDAVVFGAGAFSCAWDWDGFDGVLSAYVNGGGGLVVTGWGAYYMAENTKAQTYPGLEAVLPITKGTDYFGAGGTIGVVAGHPITTGVADFANPDYISYGAGMKPGATALLTHNATNVGAAWTVGTGRSVYLGPTYLANWGNYANEALLDGSSTNAQELFLRSVEWAAFHIAAPVIELAPSPLAVGSANVGAKASATLTIRNGGTVDLDVTTLTFSGANAAEFTTAQVLPFTVAPAASKLVTIDFTPTAEGARTAKLVVSGNAKSAEVDLTGTGTIAPDGGADAGTDAGDDAGDDAGVTPNEDAGEEPGVEPGVDASTTPGTTSDGGMTTSPDEGDDGGCACRVGATSASPAAGGVAGLLFGLLALRRRSRRHG